MLHRLLQQDRTVCGSGNLCRVLVAVGHVVPVPLDASSQADQTTTTKVAEWFKPGIETRAWRKTAANTTNIAMTLLGYNSDLLCLSTDKHPQRVSSPTPSLESRSCKQEDRLRMKIHTFWYKLAESPAHVRTATTWWPGCRQKHDTQLTEEAEHTDDAEAPGKQA